MVARIRTEPTFEILRREVFAPALAKGDQYYWDYDVHPDGKRLLMVHLMGRERAGGSRLVVVENFFTELEAKVPR